MIEYNKLKHRKLYIYEYIMIYMSKRKIILEKGRLELKDEFDVIFEKTITKFGSGAKIDAPKEFLGRKVYVVVRKA